MSNSNETFSIELFLSGDRKTGRLFLETYGGYIRQAVLKVRIKSDAIQHEDVFNGAIAHLLENDKKVLRMYKGGSSLSSYIFQVSYHYALTIAGKENKVTGNTDEMIPDGLMSEIFEDDSADETKAVVLRKAQKSLKEKDRRLLQIMFFDGRSTEEIMRLYNWNNSTVYSQKNKLLARLKKLVRKITTENVCL